MKTFLSIFYTIFSLSLLANDSLKVKTIKYFENGDLIRTESFDSSGRVVFLALKNKKVTILGDIDEPELRFIEYFGNTKIQRKVLVYKPKYWQQKVFFESNPIGTMKLTEFDSLKNTSNEKQYFIFIDGNMLGKAISIDSVTLIPSVLYNDMNRNLRLYVYDEKGRVKSEKHQTKQGIIYKCENSYDSQSRLILSFIENRVDEEKPDPTNELFLKTYNIVEKSILKTSFNDVEQTAETVLETYRRKKLFWKQVLKNYYRDTNKLVTQEEFYFNIKKGKVIGQPILKSKITNIYEQGLRTKNITYDVATNQTIMNELVYEFW